MAVERDLRQRSRRRGAIAGAFKLAGAAIACDAGELSGGVGGAVGPTPESASPGGWGGDGPGLALLEDKAGRRKRRNAGV